jgi:hypothetical protein
MRLRLYIAAGVVLVLLLALLGATLALARRARRVLGPPDAAGSVRPRYLQSKGARA